jgi:predicted metal-binding membrane protein
MSASSSTSRQERWIIAAALVLIATVAWVWMIREARDMTVTGMSDCLGMEMGGAGGTASALPPLFLMWAGMMVAMMLPSATPIV